MVVVIGVDGSGRTHRLHAVTRSASARHTVPAADTLAELLAHTGSDTGPVLVDDAHHYPPDLLRQLTAAARAGTPVSLSRRPGITEPALAELDGLAARDGVVQCDPLGADDVAHLVAGRTGARPGSAEVAALAADTCGLPALVVALADGTGPVPAALRARVQRALARQPGTTVAVARVLAVTHDLGPFPHAGLAEAVGLPPDAMAAELRALHEAGLLAPGGERLVPAVARAVATDLTRGERQDLDRALSGVAAVRDRTALHDAVALARSGRTARAARELEGAGAMGRLLAVPLLAATGAAAVGSPVGGQADETSPAPPGAGSHGPESAPAGDPHLGRLALRMAEAGGLLAEPARALPILIEAAEELDRSPAEPPLPDTPHAIGALVASAVGDLATARRLLEDALSASSGGPGHARRHHLLASWIALRGGRYPEVRATSAPGGLPGDTTNDGRDVLLSVCLRAGLARRSGDVAAARAAWSDAEHLLAREAVDLLHAECVEELVVAAARAGSAERADGVRATLREYAVVLGSAPWTALLAWTDLHVAVVSDDAASAEAAAVELAELRDALGNTPTARAPARPPARLAAQAAAARCWADALAGRVDGDDVVSAADALHAAGLPWEASRLAGQAGVRTPDSALARRLLERAREFRQGSGQSTARSVLSEREIEVGRLVLAGRTHREIGAQLFVSPKTVEHHVARMRTRLGVSTRAEFLAALREDLGDAQPETIPP